MLINSINWKIPTQHRRGRGQKERSESIAQQGPSRMKDGLLVQIKQEAGRRRQAQEYMQLGRNEKWWAAS
jgi:hypothetical protein